MRRNGVAIRDYKKSINLIVAPASDKNETGRNLERRMASVTSKDFKEVKMDRQIRMPNEIDKQNYEDKIFRYRRG